MFETLNQPVDVLTVFLEGRVKPLRFRWKGRVIRVMRPCGPTIQPVPLGAKATAQYDRESRDVHEAPLSAEYWAPFGDTTTAAGVLVPVT